MPPRRGGRPLHPIYPPDSQKPIAIVVVGGLISSLALSLFTLPLLYKAFAPPAPTQKPPHPELEAPDPSKLREGTSW